MLSGLRKDEPSELNPVWITGYSAAAGSVVSSGGASWCRRLAAAWMPPNAYEPMEEEEEEGPMSEECGVRYSGGFYDGIP